MKTPASILMLLLCSSFTRAQEVHPTTQDRLENLADVRQSETEDDSYLTEMENFRDHPLDLNAADAGELKELVLLSDLQIDNLISYRGLLGKLISIYELQSIPTWDIPTIRKLLPFVTIGSSSRVIDEMGTRFGNGRHSVLFRASEILERSAGFDKAAGGTRYVGGRAKMFFRYRYQYKNLLQYGIAGEKDPGEQFFMGKGKYGFDFYTFHFFAQKMRRIEAIALGDFTVNMGQGLIQWQTLAFSKSGDVSSIKRQSPILRPYNSSGEFYFHRGAAITLRLGRVEGTVFTSMRKLSSNLVADSQNKTTIVSSLDNSGYHRTPREIEDRNDLLQVAAGANVSYRRNNWHVGVNAVTYHFSLPLSVRPEPYDVFGMAGKSFTNLSVDFGFTHHNIHLFGEEAIDKHRNIAVLNGLLISVDPRIDLALLQRAIDKRYRAVYGDAFTENTYPENENGIYSGLSIRPWPGWRIDMYADLYKFPWLKYRTDAPSFGKDFLAQVTFTPNKQVEIYTRLRAETKQANQADDTSVTNYLKMVPRRSLRTEITCRMASPITIRQRIEMIWYGTKGVEHEDGFLVFFDVIYRPRGKSYGAGIRIQYFESPGYNSRIYAYENDVLYNFSIPAFFDRGYRYYINAGYDLNKDLSLWLRWSQTIYPGKTIIGSGLDQISSNHRSEIRLQARWFL